jgi:RNA polymerase sigma-70 factor (ECF subfamily)
VLWRKFDDSVDFRPWAFGVAKFEALAFLRDRARDRHVFGDEVLALLGADAMEAARSSEQEERALEECLQKLPSAQRELVETAYAPGVRMDELERSAGRTPMALYKSLHRIRMTLADCVQLTLNQKEEHA